MNGSYYNVKKGLNILFLVRNFSVGEISDYK